MTSVWVSHFSALSNLIGPLAQAERGSGSCWVRPVRKPSSVTSTLPNPAVPAQGTGGRLPTWWWGEASVRDCGAELVMRVAVQA